jgi:phosphoribosyl 1,2-cyclic phosphate phosphodiesterase
LEVGSKQLLIDANHPELTQRFEPGSIEAILLTHYHMDHVQALFELRWGVGSPIPVYHPCDPEGCDDLFKHPGLLVFQPPSIAYQPFELAGIWVIPLTLNHSKPTQGYIFCSGSRRIAYLTDTKGIPDESWQQLAQQPPQYIVVDCSHPPGHSCVNHNDLSEVRMLATALPQSQWVLTHISHELDTYLLKNPGCLGTNMRVAWDEMTLIPMP